MSEKQRILMVDDDIQAVDTVETLLQSVGYETNHSYMAAEGIQLARTWKPDLILLDVMFAGPPGPDGFEVSRDSARRSRSQGYSGDHSVGSEEILRDDHRLRAG